MSYKLTGVCSCKVSGDAEVLQPGEVILVHSDGSMERRTVFEVATDPATAGEKEYAIFECLRRSAQSQMESLRQEAMERKRTAMDARSELIKIAAACARFQHNYVAELEQDDLKQFGQYAHDLKKIADRMNP